MTTTTTTPNPTYTGTLREQLRRLYLVRAAFALGWAALLLSTSPAEGPLLTTLLVAYPLFDAAAVLWQLRLGRDQRRPTQAERLNVVVSVTVAVALGVASTSSIAAALTLWGAWAIASGGAQLVAAQRGRASGGQVAQMLSGGLSVLAGAAFVAQGLGDADDISVVGGYAVVGAVFFLVSAVRLGLVLRRERRDR